MWIRREDWGGGYHSLDIQAPAKNSGWRADAKFLLLSRSRLWLSAALVESSPYSRTCAGCLFPILLSGPLKTADVWRRPTPTRYYSISIKREEVFEVLSNSFTNKLLHSPWSNAWPTWTIAETILFPSNAMYSWRENLFFPFFVKSGIKYWKEFVEGRVYTSVSDYNYIHNQCWVKFLVI